MENLVLGKFNIESSVKKNSSVLATVYVHIEDKESHARVFSFLFLWPKAADGWTGQPATWVKKALSLSLSLFLPRKEQPVA